MNLQSGARVLLLAAGVWLAGGAVCVSAQAASAAPAAPSLPAAASPSVQVVTLDQVVVAARAYAPGLKLASVTVDTAYSQLIQTQATNGLSLAGKGDYSHIGSVGNSPLVTTTTPSGAAATAAAGSGLTGENIQGGLTLSGPFTSVTATAQHSIMEAAPNNQVSALNLTASQTVFDGYPGGRAAAAVQQADYTYRAALVAYDASLKSVLYTVKQAYYSLLVDQKTLLIRQATVKQDEQNLAYYQGLFTVGRATQLDVLQNQVTLTQDQISLRSAQNTVEVDRQTLSQDVGWPLDMQYEVADSPIPDMPSLTMEDALKTAFQNRPELLTLQLNLASSNINLGLQKSLAYPVVSVNGGIGVGQDWNANVNSGSFSVGASIALPILDGGLNGAQVRQAQDQISSYKVQRDQETQTITIAVKNALFGMHNTRDLLDAADQNVEAAQGQYALQKARFAVGLVTTLDVLTAFQALTTAQVGLEQAKSNYILAILNMYNVMGL